MKESGREGGALFLSEFGGFGGDFFQFHLRLILPE